MGESDRDGACAGVVLGAWLGLLLGGVVGLAGAVVIGPIRNDLWEREYGWFWPLMLGGGAICGALLGANVGGRRGRRRQP